MNPNIGHDLAAASRAERIIHLVESLLDSDINQIPDNLEALDRVFDEKRSYLVFSYELNSLRKTIIQQAFRDADLERAQKTETLFQSLEEKYAARYLDTYLRKLDKRNHLRIQHINTLIEKNHLQHFEEHLRWMQDLIRAVQTRSPDALPEHDPARCHFGRWLNDGANLVIRDSSHRIEIDHIHQDLHALVHEIGKLLHGQPHSSRLYALIKLAEHLSLELGTEIALINNIVIMRNYNKDALTGLLSRHTLNKVLFNQMEIAKATESPFSVVMCDLDHFKNLNDTHGHVVGDELIRLFADIVRDGLRKSDLAFRFGGEEFLLILPSTEAEQARVVANKILGMLNKQAIHRNGAEIHIAASFGVFEVQPERYGFIDKDCIEEVLQEADKRLYKAKHAGRNCVV